MSDYDLLLVESGGTLEIVETADESLLLVDALDELLIEQTTILELVELPEVFEILEVALQGVPGPIGLTGLTGPQGVTLFTDISAIAVQSITTRLAVMDEFAASMTDTGESANFLTVYQLNI